MEHHSDSLQSDSVYSTTSSVRGAEESNSNTNDEDYSDNNTLLNTNTNGHSRSHRDYEQEVEEDDEDEEEITPAELIEKLQQVSKKKDN